MNKKKWITVAVIAVVAILLIGGFVWFLKDVSWIGGVYYLITMIVSFVCGWFAKSKWSEKGKELLKD